MVKVTWDENTCIHAGKCVEGLPAVFKVENDKFVIDESAATDEEVRKQVSACPSGALSVSD